MARRNAARKLDALRELRDFLWQEKVWWMTPIVLILAVFGALIVIAQSSPVAPFIYTLF